MAQPDFEELVDTFAFLEDWEERYRHVIDMGKSLPPLAEAERVPATKVEGWAEARLRFRGESDAMIVKGLIAILQTLYNGMSVAQASHIDATAELGRLGLQDHLSAQRSNGLKAMIARIEDIAARA